MVPVAKPTEGLTVAKAADPVPPKKELGDPPEKTVRAAPVAMPDSRSDGRSETRQRSISRDSFDIPWPSGEREATTDQVDTTHEQALYERS